MIHTLKAASTLGTISAIGWFSATPDFAAVLLGILSISLFMLTFLPVNGESADHQM